MDRFRAEADGKHGGEGRWNGVQRMPPAGIEPATKDG